VHDPLLTIFCQRLPASSRLFSLTLTRAAIPEAAGSTCFVAPSGSRLEWFHQAAVSLFTRRGGSTVVYAAVVSIVCRRNIQLYGFEAGRGWELSKSVMRFFTTFRKRREVWAETGRCTWQDGRCGGVLAMIIAIRPDS